MEELSIAISQDDMRLAESIRSHDNGLEIMDGTVFFSARKQNFTKEKKDFKQPLQCAIEYADQKNHQVLVKFTQTKTDHWYGSFPDTETAESALLRHDSKYYEVLQSFKPRYFYLDIEFVASKVLFGDLPRLSPNKVVQKALDYVCDFAEELSGLKVSRKVQLSMSRGQSNSNAWKGKEKVSRHAKMDFGFPDNTSTKAFVTALISRIKRDQVPYLLYMNDGQPDCIIDRKPYMVNQSWRCLNSMKAEDNDPRRRFVPSPGSSCYIEDHLVGIYSTEELFNTQILNLQLDIPKSRVPKRSNTKAELPLSSQTNESEIGNHKEAEYMNIPSFIIQEVTTGLSTNRSDDYDTWMLGIWAIFNACWESDCMDLGHELAHGFSQKSAKYDKVEVDAIWNTTSYRADGLRWPTLRSWLYEDDKKLWRSLANTSNKREHMIKSYRHLYAEQYLPHPQNFKDVIHCLDQYNNRHVLPIDLNHSDVHIEYSAMDTGKGTQINEHILSDKFKSIVIYVNRTTLCRSVLDRINQALYDKNGYITPQMMFRDYRRPEEDWIPLSERQQDKDELQHVTLHLSHPKEHLKILEDQDESESTNEEEDEANSGPDQMTIDCAKYPFLVIQMESGYKLTGPPPDLIIADECESDLAQFSSRTMKRLKACSLNFVKYLQHAKKVLMMDAFVSDKTLAFVYNTFKHEKKRVVFRQNTWRPSGRRAFEITGKNSAELKSQMSKAILAKLRANEKVVLFSSNNKYAMEVADQIQQTFPEKRIYLYNKYTDDKLKDKHFQCVDEFWKDADIVIYSPVLLAGVSFNISDIFTCIFVFAFNLSCCVRDMMQASGRIRTFKNAAMYYCLDTFGIRPWNLPLSYSAVKTNVIAHGEMNKKYLGKLDSMMPLDHNDVLGTLGATLLEGINLDDPLEFEKFRIQAKQAQTDLLLEKTPDWLMDIHVRNTLEQNLTHNPISFRTVFEDFLKLSGWETAGLLSKTEILDWENVSRRKRGECEIKVPAENKLQKIDRDYDRISQVTYHEAKDIRQRRDRGTATNVEKLQLERFWFDHEICLNKTVSAESKSQVFSDIGEGYSLELLLNIWAENNLHSNDAMNEIMTFNPFVEMIEDMPAKISCMREICQSLGLNSSHDTTKKIQQSDLVANYKVLHPLANDMIEYLKIHKVSAAKDLTTQLKNNLSSIFETFGGCKLTKNVDRPSIDGRQERIISFNLSVKDNKAFKMFGLVKKPD